VVQRAHRLWQEVVKQYEEPEMDTAVKEALAEYIQRRSAELENINLYD
jgi:trimethylamine:corrinoid methyltransferase-like protein